MGQMVSIVGGRLILDFGLVAVGIVVASVFFNLLRLPVIAGYLLTGIVLGAGLSVPFKGAHPETMRLMGELGVSFLLFGIGLRFDPQQIRRLAGASFSALFCQAGAMVLLGMFFGPIMGLTLLGSLHFGLLLILSSSAVARKILEGEDRLDRPDGEIASGILNLESVFALIGLIILSGFSLAENLDWGSEWVVIFAVGVSVLLIFIFGKILLPVVLKGLHLIGRSELVTIFAIGMLLAVVALANFKEFPIALGAFLAGALLSQSELAEVIDRNTASLRGFFGALFFVVVGMSVDLTVVFQNWILILVISFLVIIGKITSCWAGLFFSGENSVHSFSAAVSKSQIGEFSFIIAGIGFSLGFFDRVLPTLLVAVATITMLPTVFLTRDTETLHRNLLRRAPGTLVLLGKFLLNLSRAVRESLGNSRFLRLLKRPIIQNIVYFILISGIIGLASLIANNLGSNEAVHETVSYRIGIWLLAGFLIVPLIVALLRNLNAMVMIITSEVLKLLSAENLVQGKIRNFFNLVVYLVVLMLIAAIFLAAAAPYFPSGLSLVLFFSLSFLSILIFWKRVSFWESQLEWMFMRNFNRQWSDREERKSRFVLREIVEKYPWPIELHEITICPGTFANGKRIADLKLREETGCSVLALARGNEHKLNPAPEVPLFSGDRLVLLGSKSQHTKADRLLNGTVPVDEGVMSVPFEVGKVYLSPDSCLRGATLANADLRRKEGVTVVGIQRGSERITAPGPSEIMNGGDVLYIVGEKDTIRQFEASANS